MEELGPAFWLAYALTGGEPFEPYLARARDYEIDLNRMWRPPEYPGHARPFPQFRVTLGDDPSLTFLPGYREALTALLELIR